MNFRSQQEPESYCGLRHLCFRSPNKLDNKVLVRLFTDIPPSKLTADLEFESASLTAPVFDCVPQDTTDESGCSAVRRASSLLQFAVFVLIILGIRTRRKMNSAA